MLLKNIPIYSDRVFSWKSLFRGTEHVGSVEVSDLDHPGSAFVGRVWDDACDVGFIVRSHVTGREKLFIEDHIDRNSENEITCWVFRAAGGDMTINVFND